MASVNRVTLIGNLGRDPETRYLSDGTAVTTVSIATTDRWKDKSSGEMKESTEWHRVVFWNRLAEVAGEYLLKGSSIYVEGKLETKKWTDKEGVERYTTQVKADNLQMLGPKRDGGGEERPKRAQQQQQRPAQRPSADLDDDEDIPF